MPKKLVIVRPARNAGVSCVLEGSRHEAYALFGGFRYVDRDNHFEPERDFRTFEVEERDLRAAITTLSRNNPNATIQTYELVEEAYVPAGELVRKKITPEGSKLPF